jgi:hypothetical protein
MAIRKWVFSGCVVYLSLTKLSSLAVTVETNGKWEQVAMFQMGTVIDCAAVSEHVLVSGFLALIYLGDRRQQADLRRRTAFVDDTSQARRNRPQENAEEDRPPTRKSLMTSIERNFVFASISL